MKRLNKKGVSLAELLAVVVIMGIIAAIAIPLVGNVIETSKKKAFLGDLVTVTEAARTYCITEDPNQEKVICKKWTLTESPSKAPSKKGEIQLKDDGTIVFYAGDLVKLTGDGSGALPALEKYLSKPLGAIGDKDGRAGIIRIITDGSKYYVLAKNVTAGDYVTSLSEENDITETAVAKDLNENNVLNFIDPTNEKALDLVKVVQKDAE